ncbi:flagellar FliJ family protein [Paraferrimonas sp. SM1919]|uniref:flagellar FliJ family protein n=1 Tax=Paraferrimonas sp. SM1919 TaxID=2662263 RepID=UPI0013CFE908|nr:flagellar FliJ family protein [Paraferrimonas sp. SM1919]
MSLTLLLQARQKQLENDAQQHNRLCHQSKELERQLDALNQLEHYYRSQNNNGQAILLRNRSQLSKNLDSLKTTTHQELQLTQLQQQSAHKQQAKSAIAMKTIELLLKKKQLKQQRQHLRLEQKLLDEMCQRKMYPAD